jgi:hyperosmotically inducible periplasmic protein
VTLTGSVQDDGDRSLAADTVENLPGVVSVDNQLKVDAAKTEHTDSWMAVKIRSRLLMMANVSASTTKVTTNDGVVTLSGTADSVAQKELTEAYARDVDGVKSVKNEIVVNEKSANPSAAATVGEAIDDASITSQVKYALMNHRSTSAVKTKVTTTNGVVRVTGDARSEAEKALVTKLAADVRGTKSVTNDMVVKS